MNISEYHQDQLVSLRTIASKLNHLPETEIARLRERIADYLIFQQKLAHFYMEYFEPICRQSCFENGLSACCGFESIFTFFTDHVVNFLVSKPEQIADMQAVLGRPNTSARCVFLGERGCLWHVRPISCAMFYCDQAKIRVFAEHDGAETLWEELRRGEKEFTWPDKPVLFDEIEEYFMNLGVKSPHLYFHTSPGLLRIKARAKAAQSVK